MCNQFFIYKKKKKKRKKKRNHVLASQPEKKNYVILYFSINKKYKDNDAFSKFINIYYKDIYNNIIFSQTHPISNCCSYEHILINKVNFIIYKELCSK